MRLNHADFISNSIAEHSKVMTQIKHTSTPYRISEMNEQGMYTNDGAITILAGDADNSVHIATVTCQSKAKRGEGYRAQCPERDANADFIVRACNAHDELMKRLASLQALLEAADAYISKHCSQADENALHLAGSLEDAWNDNAFILAKARGEV